MTTRIQMTRILESAGYDVVAATDDGTILLAGGLQTQADGTLAPSKLAELYSPPSPGLACGVEESPPAP